MNYQYEIPVFTNGVQTGTIPASTQYANGQAAIDEIKASIKRELNQIIIIRTKPNNGIRRNPANINYVRRCFAYTFDKIEWQYGTERIAFEVRLPKVVFAPIE